MAKIQKDKLPDKNIHEGHRARLMKVVKNSQLKNLSDIQVVEVILSIIIPRGDVNPLAHRLLNKFESVAGILDADANDLMAVPGIGERTAFILNLLPDIFHIYSCSTIKEKADLSRKAEIYDYCEMLLKYSAVEKVYIVALNNSFKLLGKRELATGSIRTVAICQNEITRFLNSLNPTFVFLLHNHPGGKANPSSQDIEATNNVVKMFEALGVAFIDHYILGENGIYSILNNRMEREYLSQKLS